MRIEYLSSPRNIWLKQLHQLMSSSQRAVRKHHRAVLIGEKLLQDFYTALSIGTHNLQLCALLLPASSPEEGTVRLENLKTRPYIPDNSLVFCVQPQIWKSLWLSFGANLPKIVGMVQLPQHTLDYAAVSEDSDILLLDGIQDPGNLGSILRTSSAAGIQQVYLSSKCALAWGHKTLRAAMGAHFRQSIYENVCLAQVLRSFSGQALTTSLQSNHSIYQLDLKAPVAWVFGSEGQGVSAPLRAQGMQTVHIPMLLAQESLNVSVALAVCLFEQYRQRHG